MPSKPTRESDEPGKAARRIRHPSTPGQQSTSREMSSPRCCLCQCLTAARSSCDQRDQRGCDVGRPRLTHRLMRRQRSRLPSSKLLANPIRRQTSDPEMGACCHGHTLRLAEIRMASIVVVMRLFENEFPGIRPTLRILAACEQSDAFSKATPCRQVGATES